MLKTCSNCGQNFLTEADLFVYQHRPTEEYYSCGCKEQADAVAGNPVAQKELVHLRADLAAERERVKVLEDTLRSIDIDSVVEKGREFAYFDDARLHPLSKTNFIFLNAARERIEKVKRDIRQALSGRSKGE